MLPPPWSQHPDPEGRALPWRKAAGSSTGWGLQLRQWLFPHHLSPSLHLDSPTLIPSFPTLPFAIFTLIPIFPPFSHFLSFPSFFLIIHFYHSFLCFLFLKNSSLPHISTLTLEIPCMSENPQPKGTTGQSRPSTATLMDVHDRGRAERFQVQSLESQNFLTHDCWVSWGRKGIFITCKPKAQRRLNN